jgi:predicted restriction endonuclease
MSRRDWTSARAKVEVEGECRSCGIRDGARFMSADGFWARSRIEAAHLWPRSRGGSQEADGILPLCGDCHSRFDSHRLDVLGVLSLDEQIELVRQAGGIEQARIRSAPSAYPGKRSI